MRFPQLCLVSMLIGFYTAAVAGEKNTSTNKFTSVVTTTDEENKEARKGFIRNGHDGDNHPNHRMLKKEKKKKEKSPKAKKTKSPAPSVTPSTSPSVSPSDFPSVSIMPSDTPSQPPSVAPTPIPAEEVCLVTAQKFSLEGTGNEISCSTGIEARPIYAGNEEAYYETTVGRVAINRENAGVAGVDNCQVSFQFQSKTDGTTGNSVDAVCLKNTCPLAGDATCNNQKAIIHYELPLGTPVLFSSLEQVSYTYNPINYGNGNIKQLYLNIYTITMDNNSQVPPCEFYACKFDIITPLPNPALDSFTTFTINQDDAIITRIQNTGCCNCGICPSVVTALNPETTGTPVSIRDVQTELSDAGLDLYLGISSAINSVTGLPFQGFQYVFALNMGDAGPTTTTDNGMEICVDNLTYKLAGEDTVIFDFTL